MDVRLNCPPLMKRDCGPDWGSDMECKMAASLPRRAVRAGGWGLLKRAIKPIPVIGSIFAVSLAGYEIRKKGLCPGGVHVGLDLIPVVGTTKGVIELFDRDWIPDKEDGKR